MPFAQRGASRTVQLSAFPLLGGEFEGPQGCGLPALPSEIHLSGRHVHPEAEKTPVPLLRLQPGDVQRGLTAVGEPELLGRARGWGAVRAAVMLS